MNFYKKKLVIGDIEIEISIHFYYIKCLLSVRIIIKKHRYCNGKDAK